MEEKVKTGIAALDEKIGGGFEKGSVSVLYGDCKGTDAFWHMIMSPNVKETSKSRFLKVIGNHDIDGATLLAVKEIASKGGLVVLVTMYESTITKREDLDYDVRNIADNVFYLNWTDKGKVTAELEVLKNRSHDLHDVKFELFSDYETKG